ncbi:MAG: hypothetical protein QOI07_3127 [Verrucomicrobiota bacterium]
MFYILRTSVSGNSPAVSASHNCRKRRLLFSRETSVTAHGPCCQVLFSRMKRDRSRDDPPKNAMFRPKKGLPRRLQFLQCASNPAFLMNMMIAAKRSLIVLLFLSGLALCAMAASSNGNCPLPVTGTSAASTEPATQSPEKPACKRRVFHNGMVICLPCPAADAHVRHGDDDLGPCDKPGNETPPGQS